MAEKRKRKPQTASECADAWVDNQPNIGRDYKWYEIRVEIESAFRAGQRAERRLLKAARKGAK